MLLATVNVITLFRAKKGRYVMMRHNCIRDRNLEAKLMQEVCSD